MSNTEISKENDVLEDVWHERARDLLDHDQHLLNAQIEELKQLVAQEQDIADPTDEEFYIKFLRAGKHNPSTSLDIIKSYHRLRRTHPQYFKSSLSLEGRMKDIFSAKLHGVLKHRDDHGRPVIIVRANGNKWNPDKIEFSEMFGGIYALSEMLARDPRTQIAGLTAIFDVQDFGWKQFRAVGLEDLRNLAGFFNLCFPLWLRSTHILHAPRAFQMLYTMARPFLSESVRDGIVFHSGDLATLKPYFKRLDLIPCDLGGGGAPMDNTDNLQDLRKMKEFFVDVQTWVDKEL